MKYEHQRVCAEYNAWGKPEGTAQTHACGDSRVRTMDREQREQGPHEGGEAQLHLATCHRVRSFAIVPHIPCGVGLRGRDVTSTAETPRGARPETPSVLLVLSQRMYTVYTHVPSPVTLSFYALSAKGKFPGSLVVFAVFESCSTLDIAIWICRSLPWSSGGQLQVRDRRGCSCNGQ